MGEFLSTEVGADDFIRHTPDGSGAGKQSVIRRSVLDDVAGWLPSLMWGSNSKGRSREDKARAFGLGPSTGVAC